MSGENLDGLYSPRTFFGRSEIANTSAAGAELSESTLCWNDFINVDFSGAILRRADLRSSIYEQVKFVGADLSYADLRHAHFIGCEFTDAVLVGAKLTHEVGKSLGLSRTQLNAVSWQDSDGEPPGGG